MNKSKSILIISSEFPPGPGGIGHHAYNLAKQFHRRGYPLLVYSNADYAEPTEVAEFDSTQAFPIIRFKRYGRLTPFHRLSKILRICRKKRPDTIILTGRFSIWVIFFLRLFRIRARYLSIIHGHEPIFGSTLAQYFTNYCISKSDVVIPVSGFSANNIPIRFRQESKVQTIPNGIDVSYLESWNNTDLSIQLDGDPVLLTVGHTSPRKGQHRVIKALPLLKKKYPEITYHIVGRDVNNHKLEQLAKQLGVTKQVYFHEQVRVHQNLFNYYHAADVFMLLSENQWNGDVEGFGIVALEANYFGVPVIGAKYCGVEDAVKEKISGCLVDGNSSEEIADALCYIMKNRAKMSEYARRWAIEHNWDTIGARFEAVLKL